MIELTPVQLRHTYELTGTDGYKFTVYCAKDDEFNSWSASVNVTNWGFTDPVAAVEALAPALRNLLEKIEKSRYECGQPGCSLHHCTRCRKPIYVEPHVCKKEDLTP